MLEYETPNKRRRIDSTPTPRLSIHDASQTSPIRSLFSTPMLSIPTTFSSKYIDLDDDNDVSISTSSYHIPQPSRLLDSSQLFASRQPSNRKNGSSIMSSDSRFSNEPNPLQPGSHDQRLDAQTAHSHIRSLGLFVHKPTNIIVCVQCESAVSAANAIAHISKASSGCRSSIWRTIDVGYIERCLGICDAFEPIQLPSLDSSIAPLPVIPVKKGWSCIVDQHLQCFNECFAYLYYPTE